MRWKLGALGLVATALIALILLGDVSVNFDLPKEAIAPSAPQLRAAEVWLAFGVQAICVLAVLVATILFGRRIVRGGPDRLR